MKLTKKMLAILLVSAFALVSCSNTKNEDEVIKESEHLQMLAEFKNAEFKDLVAQALDIDPAVLTKNDLNGIIGLEVYYFSERIENTMQYKDVWSVTVKKEGFNEVFEKYYDTPKEEREGLESPENYYVNKYLDEFDGYEDIKLLTGLTELSLNSEYKLIQENPVKYFKNLTGLRELSIYNYVIPDLEDMINFTELRFLSIGLDQKQIPDGVEIEFIEDMTPLASLTKLETISLSGNYISDLSPIASLPALKDLSISHAALGDISPVAKMQNLESVNFFFNGIENVEPLTKIPGLKYINLDYNYIQDITPFASLDPAVVEYVSLDMNGIQDATPLKQLGSSKVNLGYEPGWEE